MAGFELAVVLGVLLVFGLMLAFIIRSERKGRGTKLQISQSLGFTPMSEPPPELIRKINQLYQNTRGNRDELEEVKYELQNVSHKRLADGEMFIFDLINTSGDDDSYTEVQAVAMISHHLRLPNCVDRQAYRLASRLPWVMDLYLRRVGRQLEAGGTSGLLSMFPALPPSDAAALERDDVRETFRTSFLEALRQGPHGARHDYALEGRRWGVPLGEIEVPVELWHGQDDRMVSPEQGRILANALPDVSRHFPEGEGHLSIAGNRLDEIFASAG